MNVNRDLGSKIKNYSRWLIEECNDPYDEIEYLVSLILDGESESIPQILEVLEMYKNHNKS